MSQQHTDKHHNEATGYRSYDHMITTHTHSHLFARRKLQQEVTRYGCDGHQLSLIACVQQDLTTTYTNYTPTYITQLTLHHNAHMHTGITNDVYSFV